MTSRTAWTGGNLSPGLSWTTFFNGSDLNSLANGSSVLSSESGFTNGTSLDQFFDVSFQLTIASNNIVAGANLTMWMFPLQQDGSTYGDGLLTAGTGAAITPGAFPILVMPITVRSGATSIIGWNTSPLIMPPGSWRPVMQNNTGFALAASGNTGAFRSYNINLNN